MCVIRYMSEKEDIKPMTVLSINIKSDGTLEMCFGCASSKDRRKELPAAPKDRICAV